MAICAPATFLENRPKQHEQNAKSLETQAFALYTGTLTE